LQQPERWKELKKCEWRGEGGGGEETRSKLELRGGGEARSLARCKCAGGGKGGDLENATAAATQSSVHIKPGLLRSGLSILPSCPCLSRAARMDQDQSAFLVITYSQGWVDGWMNYSWWTRSTLFHWGFFTWPQRLLFTMMPILELSKLLL
jgi:hypothetical protein